MADDRSVMDKAYSCLLGIFELLYWIMEHAWMDTGPGLRDWLELGVVVYCLYEEVNSS
jgi:hypothetical protein